MNDRRPHRLRTVLRGGVAITTLGIFATAIGYYCPDQTSVLENVAAQWR
jgi:hypothetical protein